MQSSPGGDAPASSAAQIALDPLDFYALEDELDEAERLVAAAVARFVDEEVVPAAGPAFEAQRFPVELVARMADLGLLGCTLPDYGCAGLSPLAYGLSCREIERGDSALRSFLSVQSSLVMWPIHRYGSPEQKQRWLPAMARGEAIGCFGLTEPQGGSDPAHMHTHARRDGSDWVLNGTKTWISNGSIADCALLWVRTEEGVRGFLVERGTRGFTSADIEHKFSLRAAVTSTLFLDDVRVPAEAMLPGARGMRGPLSCLDQARYGIAWGVIGAAQACLREALAHAAERVVFGRPLAHTQSVQLRLADMVRRITAAQCLALRLAELKTAGRLQPAQVSLAKWNNAHAALAVARECRDLLGAAGISAETQTVRHMLNLESVVTYEGTETVHRLIIGRALTGVSAF